MKSDSVVTIWMRMYTIFFGVAWSMATSYIFEKNSSYMEKLDVISYVSIAYVIFFIIIFASFEYSLARKHLKPGLIGTAIVMSIGASIVTLYYFRLLKIYNIDIDPIIIIVGNFLAAITLFVMSITILGVIYNYYFDRYSN